MTTKARSVGLGSDPDRGSAGGESARRDEILDTAATVFAESGYSGTSLKDLADACGILPGSLYHHFASKEAIVTELLARYHAELDKIGTEALAAVRRGDPRPVYEQVLALGTAVAECSFRHRAAMQLTMYEPHAGAGAELVELVRREPRRILRAMGEILRRGQAARAIKAGVNVDHLTAELCRTMGHVGLGVMYRVGSVRQIAATLCHLVLDGGATKAPTDRALDRSPAMRAAEHAVQSWAEPSADEVDERVAHLLAAARSEFARRGYETTTIRDIASAAGMGTGSVYRFIESKQALLLSIMNTFQAKLSNGYAAVVATDSTAVEKLDALTWLNVNVLERFPEEYEIQQSWLRAIPPAETNQSVFHEERAKYIESIVAEGVRRGELHGDSPHVERPSLGVLTGCFRDLIWPSSLVPEIGTRATLAYTRATTLRGAATRRVHSRAAARRSGATLEETA